jgi:peptidoglycan/xylan/chitin deacetylase (PgdA/CDA1 family)
MKWQEVRQLAKQGVEFGGHSKSHPIFSRINNEAELREEIEGCERRIEAELGQPVLHFSYPNGKEEDLPLSAIDWTKKRAIKRASWPRSG